MLFDTRSQELSVEYRVACHGAETECRGPDQSPAAEEREGRDGVEGEEVRFRL